MAVLDDPLRSDSLRERHCACVARLADSVRFDRRALSGSSVKNGQLKLSNDFHNTRLVEPCNKYYFFAYSDLLPFK